jgi:predicted amidophosphoribosyltransferase
LNDRGFNQTEIIARELSKRMNIEISTDLLKRHGSDHQALKDKDQRLSNIKNPFSIKKHVDLSKYKSITILDDVITTGKTLNNISEVIKDEYGKDIEVNAICMFRGKPYYSDTDV